MEIELDSLFEADVPPQRLRAVLTRLFPSIVFEGKLSRYASKFRVRFSPGAACAMESGTDTISDTELEASFVVQYHQKTLQDPTSRWTVDQV